MMRSPLVVPCVVLAFWITLGAAGCRATDLTPQSIEKEIHSLGAKATVDKLNSGRRPRNWDRVLDRIETGSTEWLVVAKELSPGTDAGTSTGLQVTLAKTLPKNPGGVLRLIDEKNINVEYLCTSPFIEPDPAFLRRYLRDSKRALEQLKQPDIDRYRLACLKEIEQTMSVTSKN